MHFDAIGRVPGDPILGLMEAYAQDTNPRKFDLGVGVYKDAQGLTPIPEAVKIAEARLVESQDTKTYIGGHGNPLFGKVINELVLGADSKLIADQRAGATQTPGGTGALRLAADFIAQCLPAASDSFHPPPLQRKAAHHPSSSWLLLLPLRPSHQPTPMNLLMDSQFKVFNPRSGAMSSVNYCRRLIHSLWSMHPLRLHPLAHLLLIHCINAERIRWQRRTRVHSAHSKVRDHIKSHSQVPRTSVSRQITSFRRVANR